MGTVGVFAATEVVVFNAAAGSWWSGLSRTSTDRGAAAGVGARPRECVSGGSFSDLNEDLLGDETLVAYAAAAGTTAADGRGRNSPYTSALLAHLEQPLEIGLLFRRVRAQVLASTNGQQRPHEYQSLVREHYLSVLINHTNAVRLDRITLFADAARITLAVPPLPAHEPPSRAQHVLAE